MKQISGPADPPLKVAFFDIDGTLAHSAAEIHHEVIEEIRRIRREGVAVCLASGRSSFSAQWVSDLLEVDQPSMFFSGSQIFNPKTRETLWAGWLPSRESVEFLDAVRAAGIYAEVYTDENYYAELESEMRDIHAQYMNGALPVMTPLDAVLEAGRGLKLVTMVNRGTPEEAAMRALMERFSSFRAGVSTGHAHPDILFFNITSAEASRERAFAYFLEYFGVDAAEVAAFGDAEADLPFLKLARYGFAMENAPQRVRDEAPFIADAVEECGVARALRILVPKSA